MNLKEIADDMRASINNHSKSIKDLVVIMLRLTSPAALEELQTTIKNAGLEFGAGREWDHHRLILSKMQSLLTAISNLNRTLTDPKILGLYETPRELKLLTREAAEAIRYFPYYSNRREWSSEQQKVVDRPTKVTHRLSKRRGQVADLEVTRAHLKKALVLHKRLNAKLPGIINKLFREQIKGIIR